ISGGIDPNPDVGYPSNIYDVTLYVHRARDSKAFADNGTLYFPKGVYPGSFVISHQYREDFDPMLGKLVRTSLRNEINIIGDGWGTVLKSNGLTKWTGSVQEGFPILTLGIMGVTHWRWRKVSNLRIDGSALKNAGKGGALIEVPWSDGVVYADPDDGGLNEEDENGAAGRWQFDQVTFFRCHYGVYKPYGGIGNHYIDCTWSQNLYGVYALGEPVPPGRPGGMHNGCDRYSGGCFEKSSQMAVYYRDYHHGGGQIIFDGAVFQFNAVGIHILCTEDARMFQCAISIRNLYFENSGPDLVFNGVRSARVEDCGISRMTLIGSSVNLFNCYNVPGGDNLIVDDGSSVVAYEHRYKIGISKNLFVNSISYDATNELGLEGTATHFPAPWAPSSVWGPLRAVTSANKQNVVLSTHFDYFNDLWVDYNPGIPDHTNFQYYNTSFESSLSTTMEVLGNGSNKIYLDAGRHIVSANIHGVIKGGKYTVWSIHLYTEDFVPDEVHGDIFDEYEATNRLGFVYFKKDQWACFYGMKYIPNDFHVRLGFNNYSNTPVSFYVTDFQIIQFDDLASANSFVNSREFAYKEGVYPHKEGPATGKNDEGIATGKNGGTATGKRISTSENPPPDITIIDRTKKI
ncbi:MAG TPA: hypothetical protein VEB40_16060, partial [Flavipsychrobacter sp.]|nr:hypothetical protein [Flavipsychrobacter sp.]